MSTLTGNQVRKFIEIFEDTPTEQVQAILGSGFLADLRDSSIIIKIPRDGFRHVCGLGPISSLLLEPIGTVVVPATNKFVVRKKFVFGTGRNTQINISYFSNDFQEWFLKKVEGPVEEATLRYAKLTGPSVDEPIRKEIGPALEETALSQIWALMERQPNGEEGVLLTSGYANIFYVCDINDVLRVMSVHWNGIGWGINIYSVESLLSWRGGVRVFSHNFR